MHEWVIQEGKVKHPFKISNNQQYFQTQTNLVYCQTKVQQNGPHQTTDKGKPDAQDYKNPQVKTNNKIKLRLILINLLHYKKKLIGLKRIH